MRHWGIVIAPTPTSRFAMHRHGTLGCRNAPATPRCVSNEPLTTRPPVRQLSIVVFHCRRLPRPSIPQRVTRFDLVVSRLASLTHRIFALTLGGKAAKSQRRRGFPNRLRRSSEQSNGASPSMRIVFAPGRSASSPLSPAPRAPCLAANRRRGKFAYCPLRQLCTRRSRTCSHANPTSHYV